MNRGELRLAVRRALDAVNDTRFFSDAEINDALNEGLQTLCAIAESLQAAHQFTTELEPGSTNFKQEYALPDDVLEVFAVALNNGDVRDLDEISAGRALVGARGAGVPTHYYLRGYTKDRFQIQQSSIEKKPAERGSNPPARFVLGFDPPPAGEYLITVFYFSVHDRMESDADIPSIPVWCHRALVKYAESLMCEKDSAKAEADRAMMKFNEYAEKLRDRMITRGSANRLPEVKDPDEGEDVPAFYAGYAS